MIHFVDSLKDLCRILELPIRQASSVYLLTDENVSEHCLPQLIAACPLLEKVEVIEIEPGESSKSHEIVLHIWQHLIDCQADRQSLLINLGGGVVTDLGGFVASTYKRGIKTIHIPTSLLAMVDAAIGAKTGIDFGGIKNSVGTIYAADVIIYPAFAASLPKEEVLSGFGEIIKTALVGDRVFSNQLLNMSEVRLAQMIVWIPRCALMKEKITSEDLYELGSRKLLNLGHSMAHAMEAHWLSLGVPKPHGYCVALGILAETRIACRLNYCSPEFLGKLDSFLIRNFDFRHLELPEFENLLPYLLHDKKNRSGVIKMVLIRESGSAEIDVEVTSDQIGWAWKDLKSAIIA